MYIIKNKFIFLGISGLLVAASIFSIFYFGFRQGIDFAGGTLWQIQSENISGQEFLQEMFPESSVMPVEGGSFLIRMPEITEEQHQESLKVLQSRFSGLEELKFESIGPAIGKEVRDRAVWAFLAVLVGISLYIAFAFRKVSYPVNSWKYGIITLVTLFHDALIPAGMTAVIGYLGYGAELNTNFIIAILVVMGFSVHDTIVVFDRIRENLRLGIGKNEAFSGLVGRSIQETINRSINTSLTLVLVLVFLYFLGSPALFHFILVILVGTIVGTYSSICVASPLLTLWKRSGNI
ncbi:MAG: protein-export membrane protein SecF [Candidatus Harrisonbacteria bacterium RIFCSPLOWO2_02_FULL_41_13b]|uniref:Protein-export membrane protein SecF n=1 Tax=Candidatus Harrisonbacteria bacterium RIFCSPLOWO2_02_FULL_41_13b TaxID=1798409 RepID=A0A1G1ZTS6_9BACT|nr:MAG: protein-export membrane protein SecF [Candidatus Harrisonbacteria bacterium RIFCSPLOWO2_02_FULL_41_13b]